MVPEDAVKIVDADFDGATAGVEEDVMVHSNGMASKVLD